MEVFITLADSDVRCGRRAGGSGENPQKYEGGGGGAGEGF